jgi:hypothetical protein
MLCIALMAFVTLEEISPAHAVADATETGMLCVAFDATTPVADTEREQVPVAPEQFEHHCCAAHSAGITPIIGAALPTQTALIMPAPRHVQRAARNAPEGLERPPKATAIA